MKIEIRRDTRETDIYVAIEPEGPASIDTPVPFLTHMLETLSSYAGVGLTVRAAGDLEHHIVEDTALTLGEAFAEATPATCARYGDATVPMDDALVQTVLDTGGRPFYDGPLPAARWQHFFRSFSDAARWTLHVRVLRGTDRHHVVEAAFKSFGLAVRQARTEGGVVFSTKGRVRVRRGADARPEPGES